MTLEKLRQLHQELSDFYDNLDSAPVLHVHGIRKRTKYMRALLKINREAAQQSIIILKNISQILSPYRDAQVMVETFGNFTQQKDLGYDELVDGLLRGNPFHEDPTPDFVEMHRMTDLMDQLAFEIDSLKPGVDQEMFKAHLEQSYQMGSQRLQEAIADSDQETVHSWRKKSKHIWYLLRFRDGDEVSDEAKRVNQLDRLGKLLGEVHDLDMLKAFILTHFQGYPADPLDQYRSERLDQAFQLAPDIFD